ncbi:hypothetical protein ACFX1S_006701 [Malus domestica]
MQAALAIMAAQTDAFIPHYQLQKPNLHSIPHSFFHGISLKLPLKSQSMSFATSATTPKPLTIFVATKKVVTSGEATEG